MGFEFAVGGGGVGHCFYGNIVVFGCESGDFGGYGAHYLAVMVL